MSRIDFKGFADAILAATWEGNGVDGGDLQDMAEKFGLIKLEKIDKPCGEHCVCAEIDDFPVECFRKAYSGDTEEDDHLNAVGLDEVRYQISSKIEAHENYARSCKQSRYDSGGMEAYRDALDIIEEAVAGQEKGL